jgi:hypothetical protein
MKKIVINTRYGGFGLSEEACKMLNLPYKSYMGGHQYADHSTRMDPELIHVVETLGEKANGEASELEIVEINDNDVYRIDSYDGKESLEYVCRLKPNCMNIAE